MTTSERQIMRIVSGLVSIGQLDLFKQQFRKNYLRPLVATDGCLAVELFTGVSDATERHTNAVVQARWRTENHYVAALQRDDVAAAHLALVSLFEPGVDMVTVAEEPDLFPSSCEGWDQLAPDAYDASWAYVERELENRTLTEVATEPLLEWFFFNHGPTKDYLAAGRAIDPALHAEVCRRYDSDCTPGLDDLDGSLDPGSRTAQHLYYITRILAEWPDLSNARILEIGGGYGNLARILIQFGLCSRYDLVDIPTVASVQTRHLAENLTPDQASMVHVHSLPPSGRIPNATDRDYDLVISTFGLTETPLNMVEAYGDLIARRAGSIFIVGQDHFRGRPTMAAFRRQIERHFALTAAPYPFSSTNSGTAVELIGRQPGARTT